MENRVYDLLEKMYIEFSGRFDSVENDIKDLKGDVKDLKDDVKEIKTTIEQDINPKIIILFDGNIQQAQQLERIEQEVSKHEEIILRRVR